MKNNIRLSFQDAVVKKIDILHLCPKVVDTFLNIFHHRDTETQSFYSFSPCLRVSVVIFFKRKCKPTSEGYQKFVPKNGKILFVQKVYM